MSWLLTCDTQRSLESGAETRQDRLLSHGTLVIEFDQSVAPKPAKRLISYAMHDQWHHGFAVYANPDGSVAVEHQQGRSKSYVRVSRASTERGRTRLTYSWDGPERLGTLTLECLETDAFRQAIFRNPLPMPLKDARALCLGVKKGAHEPSVVAMALSNRWQRIGPAPTIGAGTLVDTPDGPRPIQTLQLGDLVTTRSHGDQKIRWIMRGHRPNVGFDRAFRIAAPALGLESDLVVTGRQRLELPSDQVRQVLGEDIATVETHILSEFSEPINGISMPGFQLLLDIHDCVRLNGVWAEAAYVGRLASSKNALAGTWFANLTRLALPIHDARVAPKLERQNPSLLAQLIA